MNLEDVDVLAEGFAEVSREGENLGWLEEASTEDEEVEVTVLGGFASGIGAKEADFINPDISPQSA